MSPNQLAWNTLDAESSRTSTFLVIVDCFLVTVLVAVLVDLRNGLHVLLLDGRV